MLTIEKLDGILERVEKIKNTMKDIEEMAKEKEDVFVPASTEDRLLTVQEAAERLSTSESQVRSLLKKGFLPYLVIGNMKIRESTLSKFLADYEGCDLNGEEIRRIS